MLNRNMFFCSIFRIKNKGFTLIELLVVVLIIGILAAIALPQYQKTVRKSRTAEVLTLGRALRDSMNRTLLQDPVAFDNFDYIPEQYLELLDVQFPYPLIDGGTRQVFKNFYEIEFSPEDISFSIQWDELGNKIRFTNNKAASPGAIYCYSRYQHSVSFCTMLGGKNCAVGAECRID
ncbi:Type II secretion system subunit H, I [Elusimicrobium minutum Pei191]|uniref:Type II secretion system subunit H, I n=1 Tax=Elusimicrobium minutum (strain Pei191) TaxID=445932 RepID=B2KDL5_ELUMP|nr:prepilin-type N-terminal cleavage/methylation domain-containing protein [Elusimicrobium minutum]ACC98611.1 Type II secretion system subunit H, I [Elusimicrobium minutum Pei191]